MAWGTFQSTEGEVRPGTASPMSRTLDAGLFVGRSFVCAVEKHSGSPFRAQQDYAPTNGAWDDSRFIPHELDSRIRSGREPGLKSGRHIKKAEQIPSAEDQKGRSFTMSPVPGSDRS